MDRFEYAEIKMGVPFRLVLYAADKEAADAAASAVWSKVDEFNQIMSDYEPDSELNRLCRTSPSQRGLPVSEPLWEVLSRAQRFSEQSDGAFDVTVGPVVRLWRRARRTGMMPPAEQLATAREAVGYQAVRLDPERKTVQLLRPHMQLDLGGIAMGYTVDVALKLLRDRGVSSALLDASGDIGVTDPPPGERAWRIGLAPLERDAPISRYLLLANAAVTTSGDAYQFVEIEGKRYSHIVDPKTGLGLTDHSSVTVVANDCITADVLAKPVSVLGPERGLKLIDATPGAACRMLRAPSGDERHVEVHQSGRWAALQIEAADKVE